MKSFALCALAVAFTSAGFADGPGKTADTQSAAGGQGTVFLSGGQMNLVCAHSHAAGDAGSTILYKAVELDANQLKGRIHVGRLTRVVVRFTHVNTFCYDYEAGVTSQASFYSGNMPSPLKTFFVGGLPAFNPGPSGKGVVQTFGDVQSEFGRRFNSYRSLGELAMDSSSKIAACIRPESDNEKIRADVTAALRQLFGYTDRDVTRQDFSFRQGELEAGIKLLSDDLVKLRDMASGNPDDPAQAAAIAADEKAVGLLSGQLDNYASVIANLETVQAAPINLERTINLDTHMDEFVVTASVALLKPDPTKPVTVTPPPTTSSSVTVDITGEAGLDFSLGVTATHPVTHDYFIKAVGSNKIVMDGGARDPAFVPSAFVTYYRRPSPGQFAIGPAFGVDLSSLQNYFFGVAITRAGAERFSLIGGFALNRISVLNGDIVGMPAINGSSVQTKSRYSGGYFVSVTFNLGG